MSRAVELAMTHWMRQHAWACQKGGRRQCCHLSDFANAEEAFVGRSRCGVCPYRVPEQDIGNVDNAKALKMRRGYSWTPAAAKGRAYRTRCAGYFGMLFVGDCESPGGTCFAVSPFCGGGVLTGLRKQFGKGAALFAQATRMAVDF
jgi:hypothetical protein